MKRFSTSFVSSLSAAFVLAIGIVAGVVATSSSTVQAAPATFTVTNTNDSGAGSLRQAINSANSNGNPADQDVIQFNISGSGDHIITPTTQLEITQAVRIDGFSQPGASANTQPWPEAMNGTLRIGIDNQNSGAIRVTGNNVELRGLVIFNSTGSDVTVLGADNFALSGSYLGTDMVGTISMYNGSNSGTQPQVNLQGSRNSRIGGSTPAQRNVIGYSAHSYVRIGVNSGRQSQNVRVQGNNIAIGSDSMTIGILTGQAGVGVLVEDESSNITIGGASKELGNAIGSIWGNNGGIEINDDANTVYIAHNNIQLMRWGIKVQDNAQRVAMSQNIITNVDEIGIELGNDGFRTLNDLLDADDGPNGLLNYPQYYYLQESGGNTNVGFAADLPEGDYRIEFFSNTFDKANGPRESEKYVGSTTIQSTGSGVQYYAYRLSGTGHTYFTMTATEIDESTPSGYGATSEFSQVAYDMTGIVAGSDLGVRSRLLNPEDFQTGNTLDYEYTITNHGPFPYDLSALSDQAPNAGLYLLLLIMPPQINYSGTNTSEVACTSYGPGSAGGFGPVLANHASWGAGFCGYTGLDSKILSPGESFTFVMNAEVLNESTDDFTFHSIVNHIMMNDPDDQHMVDATDGTYDMIDYLEGHSIKVNNHSRATSLPTDLSTSGTVVNPENAMTVGATLQYEYSLHNNGPSAFELSQLAFNPSNPFGSAFIAFLPPNVSYVSQSNPNLSCTPAGPAGDIPGIGNTFIDYPAHTLVICGWSGAAAPLSSGDAITTVFDTEVVSASNNFTSYIGGGYHKRDYQVDPIIEYITANQVPLITTSLNFMLGDEPFNNMSEVVFAYDTDGDDIPDYIEDNVAPDGDGNGDGIADSLQSSVASIPNPVTEAYSTLVASGECSDIVDFDVADAADMPIQDAPEYTYNVGLHSFRLECGVSGGTAQVALYLDQEYDTEDWVVRKLLDDTYLTLGAATIGTATVNGNSVNTITFTTQDAGVLDADGAEDSEITDPFGPAVLADTEEPGGGDDGGDGGSDPGGSSSNGGSSNNNGNNNGGGLAETGVSSTVYTMVAGALFILSVLAILLSHRKAGLKKVKLSQTQTRIAMLVMILSMLGIVAGLTLGADSRKEGELKDRNASTVLLDNRDIVQDPEKGLLHMPENAQSFVCSDFSAQKLSDVLGLKLQEAKVSLQTTKTEAGEVSSCLYPVDNPSEAIFSSLSITQRRFNNKDEAKKNFESLQNNVDDRHQLGGSAYYDPSAGQLVAYKDGTLTVASAVVNSGSKTKEAIAKLLDIL